MPRVESSPQYLLDVPEDFSPGLVVVPGVMLERVRSELQPKEGFDGHGALGGPRRMLGIACRYLLEIEHIAASDQIAKPAEYLIVGNDTDGQRSEVEVCADSVRGFVVAQTMKSSDHRQLVADFGLPLIAEDQASVEKTRGGVERAFEYAFDNGIANMEFGSSFYHWARLQLMVHIAQKKFDMAAIATRVTSTDAYAEALLPAQRGVNRAANDSMAGRLRLKSEARGVINLMIDQYGNDTVRALINERLDARQTFQNRLAMLVSYMGSSGTENARYSSDLVGRHNPELLQYLVVAQMVQNIVSRPDGSAVAS